MKKITFRLKKGKPVKIKLKNSLRKPFFFAEFAQQIELIEMHSRPITR